MIAADRPNPRSAKIVIIDAKGGATHRSRSDIGSLFGAGDLIVANDAATLPASLHGAHEKSGEPIEIRLAAWIVIHDPTRFIAIAFGAGDYRTRTEDRSAPPVFSPGDRLRFGALVAVVERLLDHPRLVELRFLDRSGAVLAHLARHGRPIQYAHVPEPLDLWDVWTRIAADPIAFEPPSAGFAIDWRTLAAWRESGADFVTLTHAAGISSTGDAMLDRRLPFDEPYRIPERTADVVNRARSERRRVIAVGTTVVRALEAAADPNGVVRAGHGVATGRIGSGAMLRVVDAILTGVHQPGESHFELLRAFVDDDALSMIPPALAKRDYRAHEFGDSMLIERALR